ncbi:hypothetical protein PN419_00320 [Halorubrum ezzemoulense]|uniref:hypothetical protein n=1 Tax=Halorubrum ezzemoulense TaxID=337243 RepID=UPI0023306DDF|nr:hypothetical protein [Halorubrum ezzemoulense]MDB9247451.1 hypothetical protein [Halorubrum ezzemoulense]MDB9258640.1 hypothetical protein [Halorubrum ezzemoulense]MDB9264502.1 hypothetical protein [Halorubrum ezzemoulense]MDB9269001.1 hypothetical protein [Halorubrum ezzemoulense]MDB9271470.1 hypothetical protein [Halorubrum ezzemoulense]
METTYDGALGTTINVYPSGANVTVGFDSTVVLIGPMDSSNGSANVGEAVLLADQDEADTQFGDGSGLASAYAAASANGAGEVYGVGVDTSAADPDWTGAAKEAMGVDPRYVYVDSTEETPVTEVHGVVTDYATDLNFARVFAPIAESVAAGDETTYTARANDQRLVEVAPQSATVDGASTYTAAAVVGHAARQPLGSSISNDEITVDSLGTEYRASGASGFENVTAVTKDAVIVSGATTSDTDAFSDIFQVEIVDTVALGLDEVAQTYAGEAPNTQDEANNLESDMRTFLGSLTDQRPPLLADVSGDTPYFVTATPEPDGQTTVDVGVSPLDVMEDITINLNVGRTVTFDGVEA